jgi:hypothetical protein
VSVCRYGLKVQAVDDVLKWYLNQRLCLKLRCGGWLRCGKNLIKVRGKFHKLMGMPHCADSGFADMEFSGA